MRHPPNGSSPLPSDKLRLVIIYYLSLPQSSPLTKDQIADLEAELKKAGVGDGIKAFEYVRKVREIMQMSTMGGSMIGTEKPGSSLVGGWEGGFGALSKGVRKLRGFLANLTTLIACLHSALVHGSPEGWWI